jgi:hypothetical protein
MNEPTLVSAARCPSSNALRQFAAWLSGGLRVITVEV